MSKIPKELLRKRYNLEGLEEIETEISDDDMIFDSQMIAAPLNLQRVATTNSLEKETPMQGLETSSQEIAPNGKKRKTGTAALSGAQRRKLRRLRDAVNADSEMNSDVDDNLVPNHSMNERISLPILHGQMIAAPLNLQQVAATNPHDKEPPMQSLDKDSQEIASNSKKSLSGAQRRKRRRLRDADANINRNMDDNLVPNHSLNQAISVQPLTKPNEPISVPDKNAVLAKVQKITLNKDQIIPIKETKNMTVISEIDKKLPEATKSTKFKIPLLRPSTKHLDKEIPTEIRCNRAVLSGAGRRRLKFLKEMHPNLDSTVATYIALHRQMSEIVSLQTTELSQLVVTPNKTTIPTNTSLRVRIENEIVMNEDQMILVHQSILKALSDYNDYNSEDDDEGPKFTTFIHMSGWILVTCADYESRNWLMQEVPTLKPWPKAKLTVVYEKEFSKRLSVTTKIPTTDVDNVQDALTLLGVQNKRLRPYIKNWEVLNVDTENPNVMVVKFGIDEASLLAMKLTNYRLYLGFNIICIKVDTNNVPEDTPMP